MRKSVFARGAASVALAIFMSVATVSAYAGTTRPQKAVATGRAGSPGWEYAIISRVSEISRGDTPPNVKFKGVATLCYVRESGCRELQIEGSDRVEALARAMARLGREGWEMVGESPFPVGPGNEGALFFKRRGR